jgi:hypothetical protein
MPVLEPTVRGRALGVHLRRHRTAAGFAAPDVDSILGIPPEKLALIESGRQRVLPEEVAALLALYRVTGQRRAELLDLAQGSAEPNWVQQVDDAPQDLGSLVQQESDARTIRSFQPLVVPALLQTADYTRAVLTEAVAVPAEEIEHRLRARHRRQQLLNRDPRPGLYAIIEESVLRRPTGGPTVMAGQLRFLHHLNARPDIRLRVLPQSVSAHPGLAGPFAIMDHAEGGPIVHLENATYSHLIDEAKLVASYLNRFARLAELALSDQQSTTLLARIATEHASRIDPLPS